MFLREKTINGYTYLYLVESVREGTRTKQQIIKNLGRKDVVLASGELDRLAASVARFAERALVFQEDALLPWPPVADGDQFVGARTG